MKSYGNQSEAEGSYGVVERSCYEVRVPTMKI